MTTPKTPRNLAIIASLPIVLALASRGQAAPPTSDPTAGIRFSSPVRTSEGPINPRIIKYVTHTQDDTFKIFDCSLFSDDCSVGNDCGYPNHDGTDIRVNADYATNASPVRAAADGWVSYSEGGHPDSPDTSKGYANHVIIDHGCSVQTLYGHMKSDGLAAEGAQVQCGDRIGWGAESGRVYGDAGYREHTHFEIRSSGTDIDPFSIGASGCNPTSDISLWAVSFDSPSCQAVHPASCATVPPPIDGATFVEESPPYDGEIVIAGSSFQKSWTIRNIGNQDWTTGEYQLIFSQDPDHYESVTSNRMGGPEVHMLPPAPILPNSPYTFTFDLTAPSSPGRYRAAWVMENTLFGTFGDGFWVDIEVIADPNDPNGSPVGCDTSDHGFVDHGSCWQVDYPDECSWQRCENGQSLGVSDLGDECLGQRLTKPSCQSAGDDSAWAADILVQDNAQVLPGTVFEKRWLVRNIGDTVWDGAVLASYTADYTDLGGTNYEALGYSKSLAGGPTSVPLGWEVGPGEDYMLSVTLTAPSTPGHYVAAWQLGRSGEAFGDYLWVLFEVVESPQGACVIEYSSSGASVFPGTCVQSDRPVALQPAPACEWMRCDGSGNWESGTQVNEECAGGGGYRFASCFDGDGNPSGWTGWCPGPYCDDEGGGGGGGGGEPIPQDPPPPDPEPDPGPPPCPCSGDPNINNFCYYGVDNPECPPTQPGGYCDPNGDGSFADGNWDLGYYEYIHYCG